jgi:hypothetical protein
VEGLYDKAKTTKLAKAHKADAQDHTPVKTVVFFLEEY